MAENIDGIKVGTPATMPVGSDRYPAVVVAVTPKTVTVCRVATGKNRCQWPDQDYEIILDKIVGPEVILRRSTWTSKDYLADKDEIKIGYSNHGRFYRIGSAEHYLDPSF